MKKLWNNDSKEYIDIHCHILPGIDDGSVSFKESENMLKMAYDNSIRAIIATPHVRSNNFDFDFAYKQYVKLKEIAKEYSIELYLGFEVNCEALIDFGFECFDTIGFKNSDCILLEFNYSSLPPNWQLIIKKILASGKRVIIAHPERYSFIQRDTFIAEKMVRLGCELQCDSYIFDLGHFDKGRRTAYRLLDMNLVTWVATDAHASNHYDGYKELMESIKYDLKSGKISFNENETQ